MLTLAMHSGALAARLSASPIHLMNIDYWLSEQDPLSCQGALDGNLSCLTVSMPVSGGFFFFFYLCSSGWLDWETFCLLSSVFQRHTGSEIWLDRTAGFAVLDPLGLELLTDGVHVDSDSVGKRHFYLY